MSITGVPPVGFGGIGILPMAHGLEAHATMKRRKVSCPERTRFVDYI
jgi:hypothetical protein